jgi:hypothetical protein
MHRVGGVVPVRRSWHSAAARLARDDDTDETPFETKVVRAPAAAVSAAPTLPPPVIGTTPVQLEVRASAIKHFGSIILLNFGLTRGIYSQPIAQTPIKGRLEIDAATGRLVTSRRPATGLRIPFKVSIDPFHNRIILDPAEKAQFETLAQETSDVATLYYEILSLDGMAILGLISDNVDSPLTETTPPELVDVNKETLKILVRNDAMTIDYSDASAATGMADAKRVRLHFAPDGSLCWADTEAAGLQYATPYSKGLTRSPHIVDIAIYQNTILAHGDLSNLSPRQIRAFLALYQDPEMVSQRNSVETEYPDLGQRVMQGFSRD